MHIRLSGVMTNLRRVWTIFSSEAKFGGRTLDGKTRTRTPRIPISQETPRTRIYVKREHAADSCFYAKERLPCA